MPLSYALTSTVLALEKNGQQAIGRSRGGLTTKIYALVDALGNPVELMLTPGQDHDLTCAEPLIENAYPEVLIGDKAYAMENARARVKGWVCLPPRCYGVLDLLFFVPLLLPLDAQIT